MSNPTELLPCPFCGGDAQTDFIEGESYLIECYACRAETGIKDSEEDAVAAWNRRAQPEGEAPQAEPVAYITSDKRMLVFSDRVTGNDHGMTPLYAAASLSPLCGAQQAESGAAAIPTWQERAQELGFSGRRQGYPDTDEQEELKAAEIADLRAALAAQQAAAPGVLDADEMTRLRRLMGALGCDDAFTQPDEHIRGVLFAVLGLAAGKLERANSAPGTPVQMILHCPACGVQHIDAPDERTEAWDNPPHRSHLCHGCGHIWRPADVATEGVATIQTQGSKDSPAPATSAPGTPEAPKDERKGIELWRATLRACGELPEGYEVRIELENGCGMAVWYDAEGERHVIDGEGYLSDDVNEAVDAAIQRAVQLDGGQEGSESNG